MKKYLFCIVVSLFLTSCNYGLFPQQNQSATTILKNNKVWEEVIIETQFYSSLQETLIEQGFSVEYALDFTRSLKWDKFLSRLKDGDPIRILVYQKNTEQNRIVYSKIKALKITHNTKDYYAIYFKDGYYGKNGEILNSTLFLRYPLLKKPIITSHFNLHRKGPFSRRTRPHKGTDFGVLRGTSVIAPADGIVTNVSYQARGAGRYITLKHRANLKTVYMHLSKVLVKKGQKVKKGELIAKSGNSGRSTGPHLHYELHFKNNPVNAMTFKFPQESIIPTLAPNDTKYFKYLSTRMGYLLQ